MPLIINQCSIASHDFYVQLFKVTLAIDAKRNNDAILPLVLPQRWKLVEEGKKRSTNVGFNRDECIVVATSH